MRRRVDVTARIHHPVEQVFGYLEDPLRWRAFAPAVVMRRQIDEGPLQFGTRFAAVDGLGPFRVHFTDRLAAYERNRRLVWESSAPWNATTEYVCERDGPETVVHARYEGDLGGRLWMLGLVTPTPVAGWVLAGDLRRLGRLLDREARAGSVRQPRGEATSGMTQQRESR